jgi:hypothetical protein
MENIIAVLNLAVFTALIYVIKELLDSKRVLHQHPYIRSAWLRFSMTVVVASQLVITLKPEWAIADLTFDLGMISCLCILAWLYHKHTLKHLAKI